MNADRLILTLMITVLSLSCSAQNSDTLLVMFWNMENFFDYKDGGEGESDREFSSFGSRRWTKARFQAKCNAVSKSIYWISDKYGRLPDLIGLAEIENSNVLYRLLNETALKKAGYSFIHFEGRDRRGIDVAVLYRKSVLHKQMAGRKMPVCLSNPDEDGQDTLYTRDILHTRMKRGPVSLDFVVNHHPSKYGGKKSSDVRRMAAMTCLKEICDSLISEAPRDYSGLIVMGDFNDTPDSELFRMMDDILVNKSDELHAEGHGTIRYQGKWELIDMFLVSGNLAGRSRMQIMKIPFLMVPDSRHTGEKPFRTYSGPRYIGGVSDHCPIMLQLIL